ncbi:MAG: ERV1/ALR-related protein [Terriglobus roseus]|nr:ERV1/ALR-related protein [Terriglobus roseus]
MPTSASGRRVLLASFLSLFLILYLWLSPVPATPSTGGSALPARSPAGSAAGGGSDLTAQDIADAMSLDATPIAPKLGNETAKAELGRAAWKLFHTTLARFPERPAASDQAALRAYVHLFQKLYPCGECAEHFGRLLKRFPPQVSSRNAAAGWGCHVHNMVNEELGKKEFDCTKIGDFYDCGCAEDEKGKKKKKVVADEEDEEEVEEVDVEVVELVKVA